MQSNLYIPTKIRVGFVKRPDTYTGKLAYVIYYDEKGKIRKEASFESWRDHEIEVMELDNKPRNGYIFHKGVQRDSSHFGSGRTMHRIFDSREFEFEIDVGNVDAILENTTVSKREIDQECILAWYGKDLILLPTNCKEYKDSIKYTESQYKKVNAKTLIKGAIYVHKKSAEHYIYVGNLDWNIEEKSGLNQKIINKGKKHIFFKRWGSFVNEYSEHYDKTYRTQFYALGIPTLSECISEEPVDDYAEIITQYENSYHSKNFVGIALGRIKELFVKNNYSEHIGTIMKQVNENEYIGINQFNKKETYLSEHKDEHGRTIYPFTFYIYKKGKNGFEQHALSQAVKMFDKTAVSEYTTFQNRMNKELFKNDDLIKFEDLLERLEKEGYGRPCMKREDGKLFYTDKAYQNI